MIPIIYAFLASTTYLLIYIYTYKNYFELRPRYYLGVLFILLSVYLQFYVEISSDLSIGYTALLSFITYPIGFHFIYKTNIFNTLFLAFNVIVKIYIMFIFFATIYAVDHHVAYHSVWIKGTDYFALSLGNAYFLSIGSLYLADILLLRNKLKSFFLLKRNLLFIISIQLIVLINMAWLSFTNVLVDVSWYNSMLIITSFSFEIIYFLLRLFTANSSYFSSFKMRSELLSKQLINQIDHYKAYEEQMNHFNKFKHDNQKVFTSITHLIQLKEYAAIEQILKEYDTEFSSLSVNQTYSNNLILDALLNDYAKRFEKIEAQFSSKTYIKLGQMTELDLIKLFYNILENAYEALLKVEPALRNIEISSEIVKSYLKISFVNSTIQITPNPGKTVKSDKINHGFGLSIIKDMIEKYDGFFNQFIVTNDLVPYYHLEIFLPLD